LYWFEAIRHNSEAEMPAISVEGSTPKKPAARKPRKTKGIGGPKSNKLGDVLQEYGALKSRRGGIKKRGWGRNAEIQFAAACEALFTIVPSDRPIKEVKSRHAWAVLDRLTQVPAHRNQRLATRNLNIQEAIAHADAHNLRRLAPRTVNEYVAFLSAAFLYAMEDETNGLTRNPFRGVKLPEDRARSECRDAWTCQELQQIIDHLAHEPDEWRFVFLVAIWTGARPEEILRIDAQHVAQDTTSGLWYIALNAGDYHGKTVNAQRIIVVPQGLIDSGFVRFAGTKSGRLFAAITRWSPTKQRYQHEFSKDANRWLRKIGVHQPTTRVFYSCRHSWHATATGCGMTEGVRDFLCGHRQRYGYGGAISFTAQKAETDKLWFGVDFGPVGGPDQRGPQPNPKAQPTEEHVEALMLAAMERRDGLQEVRNGWVKNGDMQICIGGDLGSGMRQFIESPPRR